MKYWYQPPNRMLAEFVRTVLVMEGFTKTHSGNLPIVTNGIPTFFCKTEKGEDSLNHISQLTLFGNSPVNIWSMKEQTTIVAYFFKPFTVASLFNCSAKELSSRAFDLTMLNPHKYGALKTQLVYASDTVRKVEVLDNLLIQLHNENQKMCQIVQYATDHLLNNSNKEIISEILETLQLNERTFQRIFKKYVGITPTQYRRICQFQQSFGQLRENRFNKISEVAYDNGFADQSHFIRSFKEFTQITPNEYLKTGLKNKIH